VPLVTDLAGTGQVRVDRRSSGLPGADGRLGLVGPENLLRWAATAFVGSAAVVAGWYLSSGEARVDDQVGPVVVALVGLLVAVGGHASLIRRMRTGLWSRREVVLGAITTAWSRPESPDISPVGHASPDADVRDGTERPSDAVVVAVPEGRFVHRPGCPVIRGKQGIVPLDDHERTTREPCGVCRP